MSTDIPKRLSVDGTTISSPIAISNIFNKYFSNKAKLILTDSLKNISEVSFVVSPTDKTKTQNVIPSLDSIKLV